MAIVNGTLKYKQDDGSIVELGPVGVDARARTLATAAGQIANNAQIAADNADATAKTALQCIGNWPLTDPTDTITTEVETLNTRVTNLENAGGTQTVYHVPMVGFINGFFNHGFIVNIPMPENLITALVNGKSFSSAVLKRLDGSEENAILSGYKRNGTTFAFQIPVNTEVGISRSLTLLEYGYVNTDMDFNKDDYGGVTVLASSSAANGGIFVEVTLN